MAKLGLELTMRLTLYAPTPQNGQTHSSNSSAVPYELFECVYHFVRLALKGLKLFVIVQPEIMATWSSDETINFSMLFFLIEELFM